MLNIQVRLPASDRGCSETSVRSKLVAQKLLAQDVVGLIDAIEVRGQLRRIKVSVVLTQPRRSQGVYLGECCILAICFGGTFLLAVNRDTVEIFTLVVQIVVTPTHLVGVLDPIEVRAHGVLRRVSDLLH